RWGVADHRGEDRYMRLEVVEQPVDVESGVDIPPDREPSRRPACEVRRVPELRVDRMAQRFFAVPFQVRYRCAPVAAAEWPEEPEHPVTSPHDIECGDQVADQRITRRRRRSPGA